MKQCLIHDNSLRFSKGIYGILTLFAFLTHNHWLVFATILLMILGIFSIKLNILYQLHILVLRKLFANGSEPIRKELGELNFVSAMGSTLLFIGFLFLYFGKFVYFAWSLILIVSLLMFLSYFSGVCVAASMYVFFKKIFKR